MPNLLKLLKPYKAARLHGFPAIALEEVPAASVILFYGGNKVTELVGNRVYEFPFKPPPFHSALTVGDGEMLNVGKFKTIKPIKEELISTRRVDVIVYTMSDTQRDIIAHNARKDVDSPRVGIQLPTYGVLDYLRFGFKWFRPTKYDVCSENCVENLATGGVTASDKEAFNTAPWDLLSYALDNIQQATPKTLWIGENYPCKP